MHVLCVPDEKPMLEFHGFQTRLREKERCESMKVSLSQSLLW